jgi:hypothetical protein
VTEEERDVVQNAVENADRFYRLMSNDNATSSSSHESYEDASLAFKSVALVWMETRTTAAAAAGAILAADVAYMTLTWHLTGDLTSAMVAALAVNWVEYHSLHQVVLQKERRVHRQGSMQG